MFFTSWLRSKSSKTNSRNQSQHTSPRFRPAFETLEGRCLPSFLTPISHGGGGTAVAVGDFNGDTRPDIVSIEVGDMGSSTLSVSLNDGGGRFHLAGKTYSEKYRLIGQYADHLAVGDFNGDQKLDVVVNNDSGMRVLLGKGDGTFTSDLRYGTPFWGRQPAVADLNGDGRSDLVAGNADGTVTVWLGRKGTTPFQSPKNLTVSGTQAVVSVAIADVTGDGKKDIVALADGISMFAGNGSGGFAAAKKSAGIGGALAVGNVNGDGSPDVVLGTPYAAAVTVLLNDGLGAFQTSAAFPEVSLGTGEAEPVLLIDVNKDGRLDMVASGGVMLNNGNGTFTSAPNCGPFSSAALAATDFNGDGLLDLVVGGNVLLNANDWNN